MAKWSVPVVFEVSGHVEVEAETAKIALEIVKEDNPKETIGAYSLPKNIKMPAVDIDFAFGGDESAVENLDESEGAYSINPKVGEEYDVDWDGPCKVQVLDVKKGMVLIKRDVEGLSPEENEPMEVSIQEFREMQA